MRSHIRYLIVILFVFSLPAILYFIEDLTIVELKLKDSD